uniref:Transcriptional regulator n=1 Tax=Strongyloides papillosus TaxID=174720 RepID=A0A0N5BJA5_STREA
LHSKILKAEELTSEFNNYLKLGFI